MNIKKRQTVELIDLEKLPWKKINNNLSYKHLNGDIDNSEHTIILRSKPREPDSNYAHYHPINEEFYCLNGEFTFDGTLWFNQDSYAYYPAYFVHGAKVHIKKGYQLYLRASGKAIFEIIEKPISNQPYIAENHISDSNVIQIQNISKYLLDNSKITPNGVNKIHLSYDNLSQTGSSIITLSKQYEGKYFSLFSNDIIEIFFIEGEFKNNSLKSIYKNMYLCEINELVELKFQCIKHGKLLISHGKNLDVRV